MLHHPLQQLPEPTFFRILRWSRGCFWVVLALLTLVRLVSLPLQKLSPQLILTLIPEYAGAIGFWAGFDYLFMTAYTCFFMVCSVWAAGRYRIGSFGYNAGIALAWLSLLQLFLDMSENCCMWLLIIDKGGKAMEQWLGFFSFAKVPIFAATVFYVLITSMLVWFKVLDRQA
ncbi:MAG: hypothetical protein IPK76_06305 [Lewinellaceae bacterium]|jgi:hypothetical protein|nr:hypothetical protein [Lewinellaceae bacterium]